jgi:DNA-binding MltR family transcriptional regulator
MGWSASTDHEAKAIARFASGDDHTAAIIAGTIVEARLRQALEKVMVRDAEIEREMFHPSGPIGDFAAKIRLAFLLGLISKEGLQNLNLIKDVRNRFAHWVEVESFKSSNVKSLTDRFSILERHFEETITPEFKNIHGVDLIMNMEGLAEKLTDSRWRFLMAAMFFSTALLFPRGNKPLPR